MLGNFFMFLIAGYLQIPLDPLEPSPTTLDLQTSTHNPLDPQTLDPRPTTPSIHNNKRIFLFIPLYGRSRRGPLAFPKVHCSEGPLFRRFDVPKVRYSEGSMFRRFIVSKVRYSEIKVHCFENKVQYSEKE